RKLATFMLPFPHRLIYLPTHSYKVMSVQWYWVNLTVRYWCCPVLYHNVFFKHSHNWYELSVRKFHPVHWSQFLSVNHFLLFDVSKVCTNTNRFQIYFELFCKKFFYVFWVA